ncbi:thiamine-phosphate kinase [Curvibacter sp. APW13]|uniref:thiamine-phosphate kinase n=1 Tax=Curvibacter sp. APW13 TaxID=3077236 RepID=UPI0028DED0F4|nr:thiamine-phosphate kinase [Curvibacter sp. APW13]MDT8990854.1 thiamine-phosphate kinase [Curvibacter sp. APW13]
MGEFELIRRYFDRPIPPRARQGVDLGIGDDCALITPGPGMQLAVSSDMLVSGRHFFADVDPRTLGHKALAVNLSDLAACGARPLAFTLALALPEAQPAWLEGFAQGLFALADAHGCALVGGDTTQGPLNLCITVFGEVPQGQALLRSGARVGDDLWVSGSLGDAALGLQALLGRVQLDDTLLQQTRQRLECPTPRVALGTALRGMASACADVSDGLLGDLGHILERSGVGARIDLTAAMLSGAVCAQFLRAAGQNDPQALALAQQCVLAGGDDYELVFCAPPTRREDVQQAAQACGVPVHRIGRIEAEAGLRVVDAQGTPVTLAVRSFDHFAR